jgi:thioredoxin reductase (NADPH)
VEILTAQEAVSIRREDPYRIVQLADGTELSAYAVVLTTGMAVRVLDVPGFEPLLGSGVYYGAALSEAVTYSGHDVCIVGAANSAGQAALFFARYARRVIILARAHDLTSGMSHYLVERIKLTGNIEVIPRVEVAAVRGAQRLEQIVLHNLDTAEESTLEVGAMFVCIGTTPRTEFVAGLLDLDESGYILTGPDLPRVNGKTRGWSLERDPFIFETNVPGIFAAGDVRAGANRRVASAVGEGSAAIYSIHKYLDTV